MSSLASAADTRISTPGPRSRSSEDIPDYCARALALWPRVDRVRLARVRHNPRRVATLISHRTNLSRSAILELLGVPGKESDKPERQN
jgi:hypothetical protein